MNHTPRWLVPVIILLVLIVIQATRWEKMAQKTDDDNIYIIMHDRLSGDYWVQDYNPSAQYYRENIQTLVENFGATLGRPWTSGCIAIYQYLWQCSLFLYGY
jgi:hypothetical protein